MGEYTGQPGSVDLTVSEFTTQTPGHANTFNPFWRQIMNNDADLDQRATEADQRLKDMEDELSQTVAVANGSQVIPGGNAPAIAFPRIEGRTLVNGIGDAGGCENLGQWEASPGAVIELDSTQKVSGTSSLKVTFVDVNSFAKPKVNGTVEAGGYYVVIGFIKPAAGSAFMWPIMFQADGATVTGDFGSASPTITDTTKFSISVTKMLAPAASEILHVRVTTTDIANFDDIRVHEITQSEYDELDTMTAEEIAAKYPYVGTGIHGIKEPTIEVVQDNLLPAGDEWGSVPSGIVINAPYELTISPTTQAISRNILIPVIVGEEYTLSGVHDGEMYFRFKDSNGADLSANYEVPAGAVRASMSATAPSGATHAHVFLRGPNVGTVYEFSEFAFVHGVGTTFAPQRRTTARALTTLRSNADGSVKDELRYVDGRPTKFKRLEHVVLDGSLGWVFTQDYTGFKQVNAGFNAAVTGDFGVFTKYDGKLLVGFSGEATAADMGTISQASGAVYVTVSDADSGWGESYTPTADEIKAYFNGWKMGYDNGGTFATPYNGTGSKRWRANNPDDTSGGLAVLPTEVAGAWWTPYELQYELATPTTEDVYVEGHAIMERGDNYVTLSSEDVPAETAEIMFAETTYSALSDGLRALAKPQEREVVLWEGSAAKGAVISLAEDADNFIYLKIELDVAGYAYSDWRVKDNEQFVIRLADINDNDTSITVTLREAWLTMVNSTTIYFEYLKVWLWDGNAANSATVTLDGAMDIKKIIGVRA